MKIFTVTEAARKLGLDPSEVRRQIRNKKLRAQKTSAGWVMDASSLASFEKRRLPRGRPKDPIYKWR